MRIVFIGASHWHLPLYLEPALAMPGVTIAGVADPNAEVVDALKAKLGCAGDTDYRELCRRVKPSVYFRPTAQPTSDSPAKNRMIHAMTNLRTEHDPEKHVLGPDRGWVPVFGKDHAP